MYCILYKHAIERWNGVVNLTWHWRRYRWNTQFMLCIFRCLCMVWKYKISMQNFINWISSLCESHSSKLSYEQRGKFICDLSLRHRQHYFFFMRFWSILKKTNNFPKIREENFESRFGACAMCMHCLFKKQHKTLHRTKTQAHVTHISAVMIRKMLSFTVRKLTFV